jgi:peptide/nickel transport system permease protein
VAEPVVMETPGPAVTRRRWLGGVPGLSGNAAILFGGGIVVIMVLVAIFAPLLAPHDPNAISLRDTLQGPSASHPLGTDSSGRDILSRLIYGTRLSLAGPALVVLLSGLVAVPLGVLAGFRGGIVDTVLSRTWDAMFAFPPLLLAIVIVAAFGAGFWTATIAIAITYVPLLARVVRAQTLVEREKAYIDAGRVQGFSGTHLARAHILPNIAPTVIAQATLNFGYALIDLAGLAFLGLGVQEPSSDWGTMLANGREFVFSNPGEVIFASISISITVVAFNVLGDALSQRVGGRR